MNKSYIRQTGGVQVTEGTEVSKSYPFGYKSITAFPNGSVEVITTNKIFSMNVSADAITLTDGLFAGTATQLAAKLRDEVFNGTANFLTP